ncbi:unnamed protein product [Ixodes pacificus]
MSQLGRDRNNIKCGSSLERSFCVPCGVVTLCILVFQLAIFVAKVSSGSACSKQTERKVRPGVIENTALNRGSFETVCLFLCEGFRQWRSQGEGLVMGFQPLPHRKSWTSKGTSTTAPPPPPPPP